MDRYFRILGLPPGASDAAIREAYRDLVKVWHPDRFSNDPRLQQRAEEELKRINDAYQRVINGPRPSAESSRTAQSGEAARRSDPPPATDIPQAGPAATGSDDRTWTSTPQPARVVRLGKLPALSTVVATLFVAFFATALAGDLTGTDDAGHLIRRASAWLESILQSAGPSDGEVSTVPPPPRSKDDARRPDVKSDRSAPVSQTVRRSVTGQSASPVPSGPVVIEVPADAFAAGTPAVSATSLEWFGIGDSKRRVKNAQGDPTTQTESLWRYGASTVSFRNGRVSGYANAGNLRVRLKATAAASGARAFSLGATQDEVLALQGTPTAVADDTWFYSRSTVTFAGGRVGGYANVGGNLRVK